MTVTHVVDDPAMHFVRKAEIRKNGETVISETYTGQPSKDTFTYRYPLILSPGDEIVATVECSIGGSATARFIMPGPTATAPQAPGSTPLYVYHAILMVTGILFILSQGFSRSMERRLPAGTVSISLLRLSGALSLSRQYSLCFRVPYPLCNPICLYRSCLPRIPPDPLAPCRASPCPHPGPCGTAQGSHQECPSLGWSRFYRACCDQYPHRAVSGRDNLNIF